METFIIILIDIAVFVLVLRFVASFTVKGQLNVAKKDPKKYLTNNIDDSVKNKERLLGEIEKIDEIIKVDYWGWIKGMFNSPPEKKPGTTSIEALVKTAEGLELWYKFTMKKNKLLKVEKTYRPLT